MTKFGIKVPFDESFLWVVSDAEGDVLLFDTKEEAEEAAKIWKNSTVERFYRKPAHDLEMELYRSEKLCEKTKDYKYAQSLYAALCNNVFVKSPEEKPWSCTWRYAGGILAKMRGEGDYLDFYCSSFQRHDSDVGEGFISQEVAQDLKELGWECIEDYYEDYV